MQAVARGAEINLDVEFRRGNGQLVDPTDPRLDITNPDDVELVSNAVPTHSSTGRYTYAYTIPPGAPLGLWIANWTATIDGAAASAEEVFEVTLTGSVSTGSELVSLSELATITGQSFTDTQEAALALLITMMQSELEDFVNRPLTPRSFTGELVSVNLLGRAFLRHTPVISVEGVEGADGNAFTGTYTVVPGGLSFGTSTFAYDLVVDYTAGLSSPENQGLKSILLARLSRIVAKVHDDALGVSSLGQEGYNAAYLEEGWTEQELKIAERRRKRVVRVGG